MLFRQRVPQLLVLMVATAVADAGTVATAVRVAVVTAARTIMVEKVSPVVPALRLAVGCSLPPITLLTG